jgi:hypothetical protein
MPSVDFDATWHAFDACARRCVHLHLCARALGVWRAYVQTSPRLDYVEGVVGTSQQVDVTLPADALAAAHAGRDDARVYDRYAEPIAAMQDDDLEFPERIAFAYYAIYNAFLKLVVGRNIEDWLIVNQALASAPTELRAHLWLDQAFAECGVG